MSAAVSDDDTPDLLTAALAMAARGWHLLPVGAGREGKAVREDLCPRWSRDSTTDPQVIASWLAGAQGVGIAVDLSRSGLAVVDVDYPARFDVPEALLAGAWTYQGNRARRAYLFATDPAHPVPSMAWMAWGEVKAAGSYVILPPSPHHTGVDYRWLDTPGEGPALFPEALRPYLAKPDDEAGETWGAWDGAPATPEQAEEAVAILVRQCRRVADTPRPGAREEGAEGRNQALNRAAFIVGRRLWALGDGGADMARDSLLEAARRCGLVAEDGELACRRSVRSGLRDGAAQPVAVVPGGLADASDILGPPVYSGHDASLAGDDDLARARAAGYDDLSEAARRYVWEALERRAATEFLGRFDALANPAPPFVSGWAEDLPDAPTAWRVADLLPQDAGMLVVAQRKAGKTTWVLNLALSLATGDPFLGRFAVAPLGPGESVALLNYEVSPGQVKGWIQGLGMPASRLYVANLRGRRNPLGHPEDRALLAAELRAAGTVTLIVDPFGNAFTGESQNDAGAVGAWLVDLDRFAREEVGAREVILVAHAGWNGDRARGSSALEGWPDSIVWLTLDAEGDDADEGTRYMKATGRDVDVAEDRLDWDPATRRLTLAGVGSRAQARRAVGLGKVQARILEVLVDNPGASKATLESLVGGNRDKVREALAGLVSQGLVREVREGQAMRHYLPGTP